MSSQKVAVREGRFGYEVISRRVIGCGDLILSLGGDIVDLNETPLPDGSRTGVVQISRTKALDVMGPGRWITHSCDPNVGLLNDTMLVALRDIAEGEPLGLDFSTAMSENLWATLCHCGADNCRGVIRCFHDLPAPLQDRYLSRRIVQRFIVAEHRKRSVSIDEVLSLAMRAV